LSPRSPARIVTLCALVAPAYHGGMDHLFLDESGNHSLNAYEPSYPVFVLGGVLIHETDLQLVNASVRTFKQVTLGDDHIVLHTADIARNRRGFEQLTDPAVRRLFYSGLNCLMAALPFRVVACAIDKPRLVERYGALAVDPYALSLGIVVERFCFALGAAQHGRIVVECRSPRLDRELRTAWDLLRINGTRFVRPGTIGRRICSFDFRRKDEALPGLELADLVVSPLGRLVAGMPNRLDTDIVVGKLRTGPDGGWEGAGLVILPKGKGRGPLRSTRPRPV
jgi:hypothetical protein